jgi:D-glycero-D-manno-heptose 1,7-bisphosphate phosphatase
VFLDRDGVINKAFVRDGVPHPPASLAELELLPGVDEALHLLADQGWPLIVVTNQPDVARGTQRKEAIEEIHAHLRRELPILQIYACYHDNADRCSCRKPLPGMWLQAADEHSLDLRRSYSVGDRWSDVVAGAAAGTTTYLLDFHYSQGERCSPDFRMGDLLSVARSIVSHPSRSTTGAA